MRGNVPAASRSPEPSLLSQRDSALGGQLGGTLLRVTAGKCAQSPLSPGHLFSHHLIVYWGGGML